MSSVCLQRNSVGSAHNPMTSLEALHTQKQPLLHMKHQEDIIFPAKMYGEWRRIKYAVTDRNKKFVNCSNSTKLSISFRRTLNDFVRTSQTSRLHRVSVTWITDGEWHDNERITIDSETQFSREVCLNNVYYQETVRLDRDLLHLVGYNGRFWYRAVFRKTFYPMNSIAEMNED